ncbi:hypothetical protein [Aurantiacibacter gangjinensis]|nr:hypothetical protein [Aurantiacibacter gangjinensis]APE29281.1 hypothetical protein BMF35_b0026 [Aurantiacibacter gangjinensis]
MRDIIQLSRMPVARIRWAGIDIAIDLRSAALSLTVTFSILAVLANSWQQRLAETASTSSIISVNAAPQEEEPVVPPPPPPPEEIAATSGTASAAPIAAPDMASAMQVPMVQLPSDFVRPAAPSASFDLNGRGRGEIAAGGTGERFGGGAGDGQGDGSVATRSGDYRDLRWAPTMNHRALYAYYPEEALDERMAATVLLDCIVEWPDTVSDCRLIRESVGGWGFAEAALAAEEVYRVELRDGDGNRVYNERFTIRAQFRP